MNNSARIGHSRSSVFFLFGWPGTLVFSRASQGKFIHSCNEEEDNFLYPLPTIPLHLDPNRLPEIARLLKALGAWSPARQSICGSEHV